MSKIDFNPDSIKSTKKEQSNIFSFDDDENILAGFIGTNRTGKSSEAAKLAKNWRDVYPETKEKSGRIISFDPQRRFQKISTDFIFSHDKDWCKKILKFRNSLVILDDYRLIHKSARVLDDFEELMYMRAEYNLDIIYICHNPALVINTLSYFTNLYFIFQANTQEGGFEKKIPSYTLCEQGSNFINDYTKHFGKGEYPNFPHIILNCNRGQLYARNVDMNLYKEKIEEIKIKSKR